MANVRAVTELSWWLMRTSPATGTLNRFARSVFHMIARSSGSETLWRISTVKPTTVLLPRPDVNAPSRSCGR